MTKIKFKYSANVSPESIHTILTNLAETLFPDSLLEDMDECDQAFDLLVNEIIPQLVEQAGYIQGLREVYRQAEYGDRSGSGDGMRPEESNLEKRLKSK